MGELSLLDAIVSPLCTTAPWISCVLSRHRKGRRPSVMWPGPSILPVSISFWTEH